MNKMNELSLIKAKKIKEQKLQVARLIACKGKI